MKIIAIVPIKHNSERVPGKNYKLFNGVPLYRYILDTLNEIEYISEIVVDTNSHIIKDGLKENYPNIKIYNRPDNLSSGDTPVNKLLINVINQLKLDGDIYIQTHTTNPLLRVDTINKAIEKYKEVKEEGYDSLFTVKEWKTRLYNKDVSALNHNINELIPTQNLEPLYEENSCLYIFTKKILEERNHRIGYKPYMYIMNDIESQDIDIPSDFTIAEVLHRTLFQKEKKVLLITGINGGIGQEISNKFKSNGWYIVGTDIHTKCSHNNYNRYISKNLIDINSCKEIIEEIENNEGRIDCIVNNAALQINKKCWEYTEEDWSNTFSCNFKPIYQFVKYGLNLLKKNKGNIINIGSVHTICTSDSITPYSASKSAMLGLTKNMAIELGEYGIRVNTISPGAVNTSMLRESLSTRSVSEEETNELVKKIGEKHILGQIGEPEDISHMVYTMCNNKFLTGSHIVIDGGVSIQLSSE